MGESYSVRMFVCQEMRSTTLLELSFVQLCSFAMFFVLDHHIFQIFSQFIFLSRNHVFVYFLDEIVPLTRRLVIFDKDRCTMFKYYRGNVRMYERQSTPYMVIPVCVAFPPPPPILSAPLHPGLVIERRIYLSDSPP